MTCALLILAGVVAVVLVVKFYGPAIRKRLLKNIQ